MTEFGHLPKVWEVVRFGDKGQFQYGYTTSATDENTGTKFLRITDIKEDGTVNWGTVPYGNIDDNNLQKFRLSKSDILFARIGATTGKTCIIGGVIPNAVFASYLIRFVPDKELHPKYVFYFTQTREYQELVNAGKEGKLKKGLSATELKNFNIPLPPLPEQQKIAKVISTVQQAKEKTDAVISATKELKKSLMRHLFTYGHVPVKKFNELRVNELQNAQNSKNSKNSSNSSNLKNSINLKETEIGLVPEEWDVVRLGEVVKKTEQKDPRKTPEWQFKYIDVSSINREDLKIVEYKLCLGKDAPSRAKKLVEIKDVIFATVRPTLRRLTLIEKDFDGEMCSTAFCVLRAKESFLSSLYLLYAVQRDIFIEELEKIQRGASYPAVTDSDVKNQILALPPLPVQQNIASILSAVDDKIEKEETKKKSLDELFKSLLQNLMTGKLRVNEL